MMIEMKLESVFVDITARNGKQIRVGSIYRSPNTCVNKLIECIEKITTCTNKGKTTELILGMDQNLDLLKSDEHAKTRKFLDTILDTGLWPVITRPTRITQTSAMLIDNIYISKNLQHTFDSTIIIDDITDHLRTLALLRQTKVSDKQPLEFESHVLNKTKLKQINRKLRNTDYNGLLNSDDVNQNFDRFTTEIALIMDTEAPIKTV